MVMSERPTPEEQSPVTADNDTSPAPRRTSVKQIEANRKNALRSTGPTTREGKQASRLNALKHGLRAKDVIIPGQENPAELEAILRQLREDWEPQSHTERHLVEQIGLAEWRLRRVQRAELGEIRRQMSSATKSNVQREIDRAFEYPKLLPQTLGESSAGIVYQLDLIKKALAELESQGTLSEETCDVVEEWFGTGTDSPARMLEVWFRRETPSSALGVGSREAARKYLEMTLDDLERQERELRKRERTDLEIIRQRMSIPRGRELERIQRYETSIKRDMYRAIDQLERLQRRRRGEPPPPTVNVNVSSDDEH